jgi:hypothetical protein
MKTGWIGVDLDGTLAEYHGWNLEIGKPIPLMVERVKRWLAEGIEVRIVTARVGRPDPLHVINTPEKIEEMRKSIMEWCERNLGQRLVVTHEKDYDMLELWDDRAVQVENNTGRCVGYSCIGSDSPDPIPPQECIRVTLSNCSRCGGTHESLLFGKLLGDPIDSLPGDYTHWAMCPTTRHPIVLQVIQTSDGPTAAPA